LKLTNPDDTTIKENVKLLNCSSYSVISPFPLFYVIIQLIKMNIIMFFLSTLKTYFVPYFHHTFFGSVQ